MTDVEAISLAKNAVEGKANLTGGPVRVVRERGRVIVIFVHETPPDMLGPDYDARVTLDADSGEVLEVLGAP